MPGKRAGRDQRRIPVRTHETSGTQDPAAARPAWMGLDVEQTATHLKRQWEGIEVKLLGGDYKPAAVKAVEIPKANGGKRQLGIPSVQDRLIQQAIHQSLGPLWEADFSDHSHGFRPNRSAHGAVREAQSYIQAGKKWVVDIDLKSFFDEVDHDKLMHLVRHKVKDKRLRGWWNYFRFADWRREVEDLSGWIRRHMRKCFWQRWKTPRGRKKALRRLGVKGRALGNAYCRAGAWPMSRHWVMNQALKNRTLEGYGFILPWNFAEAHL